MKIKVKEFSIRYCKAQAFKKRCRITEIEKKLKVKDSCGEEEKRMLENELDILYTNKAKGAQIRSRAIWTEKGEKNNKYFLQLEKSRQTINVIHSIKTGDKEETSGVGVIKNISEYYKNLYTSASISNESISSYLNDIVLPRKLTDIEKNECEGMPTEKEIKDIIYQMKKGKAPGYDGLPIEFYQAFWSKIKSVFRAMVIETSIEGELPSSAKHAILSLIYKKGDRKLLTNYRPISLTNADYKIIAFVLANRVQKVLSVIIDQDQSGYIKGRYIGNNVQLVLDIFEYCEMENKEGALIMLDYQKAFDTVE